MRAESNCGKTQIVRRQHVSWSRKQGQRLIAGFTKTPSGAKGEFRVMGARPIRLSLVVTGLFPSLMSSEKAVRYRILLSSRRPSHVSAGQHWQGMPIAQ